MSTDSTELTFVRCPSCRSLVPAISTRCRMCGATLEASAAPDAGDQEQKRSGRVRQRTMSESSPEAASAAIQVREQTNPMEVPIPIPSPKNAPLDVEEAAANKGPVVDLTDSRDLDADDPLSAYIEEVDASEDAPGVEAKTEEPKVIEPKVVEPKVIEPKVEMKPASQNGSAHDNHGGSDESPQNVAAHNEVPSLDVEDAPDVAEPSESDPFDMPDEEPAPKAAPSRVVIETGSRKSDSRLNFGGAPRVEEPAPKVEAPPARAEQARPEPQQNRPAQQNNRPRNAAPEPQPRSNENEQKPRQEQRQPQQSRPQPGREERRDARDGGERREQQSQPKPPQPRQEQSRPQQQLRAEQQQTRSRQNDVREERPLATTYQAARPESAAPALPKPNAQKQTGRLFGWFVNYADPAGEAVEIREGKFFLSGKSVKPTDLVIDDKTISTPHALMTVSPATGLIVQDLMSERGVFIRKKNGEAYKKEEESVTLTHGDWVRFGDVEFLISLIAYPGEK